jgi:hypothetical protein
MGTTENSQDTSIFYLGNLSSVPDDVKENLLLKNSFREDTKKVMILFDIKRQLNVDEIVIGLYRKYGLTKKRPWVNSTLNNLIRSGFVKRIEYGKYEKV